MRGQCAACGDVRLRLSSGRLRCGSKANVSSGTYDKARDRNNFLKRTYGITQADYDQLLASQGGGCAICGSTEPGGRGTFHVDHDHVTGKVRGLLCGSHNAAVGALGDSYQAVKRALEYLAPRTFDAGIAEGLL